MPRQTPEVLVRPARRTERAAVTRLLIAQLREHRIATPAARLGAAVGRLLARPSQGRILVAATRRRLVGIAALSFARPLEHADRTVWLEELYVAPAWREQGIGRRLLRAACAAAAAAGAVAVDLEVDAGHARAARLYAREGFRPLRRARWVRRLARPRRARPTGG
jgi:ribosomal protein S18 acetylase RimI-like enzyme